VPLQRRPPGHELEAKTVVDHSEASRGQGNTPPVDPGDVLTLSGWAMNQTFLDREPCRHLVQFPLPQGVEPIAREDDTLTLAARQTFRDEAIDAPVHRLVHLNAESVAARCRFSCQELTIKPGGSRCGDLGIEREIRPCGER
jgi:hypothetical protein